MLKTVNAHKNYNENLSITQEITITVVAIFFLMISLLGFIVAKLLIDNNTSKLEWQKETNMELAKTILVEPVWTLDINNIEKSVTNFVQNDSQIVGIKVIDNFENTLSEVKHKKFVNDKFDELINLKNHSMTSGNITKNGEYLGRIDFIYSTQNFIEETVLQITVLCLIFLLTGIVFGFVILWHLKKTITSPLERIVAGSKMMAQGNYNFQVEQEPVLEFQELVESLNVAIRAIRDRDNKLKNNLHELQEVTESKSKFVSTMSHEIRTPLNAIIGLTELTLSSPLKQDQRDNLETVKLSADSLLNIVNEILDFSAIEANKVSIQSNYFNLFLLMQDCIQIVNYSAQEKDIDLHYSFDKGEEMYIGDPQRIKQVVLNLLNNAIKFSKNDQKVHLKVIREYEINEFTVFRVEVIDHGIGIEKSKIKNLFEAFSQIDQSINRVYGGSGLGLSISKKLIELMGGVIGVNSQIGKGSTFWFQIKLVKYKS